MESLNKRNTLSGMVVAEAMRRQVVRLSQQTPIGNGVIGLIKHKINALLIVDDTDRAVGVVSKTDIMCAYYAGLPTETPLFDIMNSPPLFCRSGDSIEEALGKMKSHRIYRLYVTGDTLDAVAGVLAYPDIVGLLYGYCYRCEFSRIKRKSEMHHQGVIARLRAKDVMTPGVKSMVRDQPLIRVIEELSAYRIGALLITDRSRKPCGVISKTDLALTYKHGRDLRLVCSSRRMKTQVLPRFVDPRSQGTIQRQSAVRKLSRWARQARRHSPVG